MYYTIFLSLRAPHGFTNKRTATFVNDNKRLHLATNIKPSLWRWWLSHKCILFVAEISTTKMAIINIKVILSCAVLLLHIKKTITSSCVMDSTFQVGGYYTISPA